MHSNLHTTNQFCMSLRIYMHSSVYAVEPRGAALSPGPQDLELGLEGPLFMHVPKHLKPNNDMKSVISNNPLISCS